MTLDGVSVAISPPVLAELYRGQISPALQQLLQRNPEGLFMELVQLCFQNNNFTLTQFVDTIRLILEAKEGDLAYTLTDVLWLKWLEVEGVGGTERSTLLEMVTELLQNNLVAQTVLMEVCDGDMLQELELIQSKDVQKRKEIRYNTKQIYRQQKFNILREENEGYSKLITLLEGLGAEKWDSTEMWSLIGYFELDPNRVVNIVLEMFEANPISRSNAFLQVLSGFQGDTVAQMLGFVLQSYQSEPAPNNVFLVAAQLIKGGIFEIEQLWPHLKPGDEEVKEQWKKGMEQLKQEVDKIGQVNLQSSSVDQDRGDLKKGSNIQLNVDYQKLDNVLVDSVGSQNTKFKLLEGLLTVGDWSNAQLLLLKWQDMGLDVVSYRPIGLALCQTVHSVLDTVYQKSLLGSLFQKEPATDIVIDYQLIQMIRKLGVYIFRDVKLIFKLLRLFRVGVKGENKEDVLDCLADGILSACMLTPHNPALLQEAWQVLSQLRYTARYAIYAQIMNAQKDTIDSLYKQASQKIAQTQVRRLIRTVYNPKSTQERRKLVRDIARSCAKVAHMNIFEVMRYITEWTPANDNFEEPMVEILRFVTPWALDILTYFILLRLVDPSKRKVKEDNLNISNQLQNLASFTGLVSKRYQDVDLTCICQFIINRLRSFDPRGRSKDDGLAFEECFDLLVFKEVVATMTGIKVVHDISSQQLESSAGGTILSNEALLSYIPSGVKQFVKGMKRLVEALREASPSDQLIPMLILLSQQRQMAAFYKVKELKMLAELYDDTTEVLLQYAEFLKAALTTEELQQVLPPMHELVVEYGVEPEIVFQCYRPILTKVWPINREELEEGQAVENNVSDSMVIENNRESELGWEQALNQANLMLPLEARKSLTPRFYLLFWSLQLSDVYLPVEKYEKEISRLKADIPRQEEEIADMKRQLSGHGGHRRRDFEEDPQSMVTEEDLQSKKKELAKSKDHLEKLPLEMAAQKKQVERVHEYLKSESETLLQECQVYSDVIHTFLLHCILPRVTLSPADAVYCARFTTILHQLSVQRFKSILYHDRVIYTLTEIINCCTDREARNFAWFLLEELTRQAHWRSDEAVYKKECMNRPGFGVSRNDSLPYFEYRRSTFKWQHKLARTFKFCLESGEYVQIRNALLILHKIVRVWPALRALGQHMMKSAQLVLDTDGREDLKMLAQRYIGDLQREMSREGRMFDVNTYGGGDKVVAPQAGQQQGEEKQQEQRSNKTEITANGTTTNHEKPQKRELESQNTPDEQRSKRPRVTENDRTHRREKGEDQHNKKETGKRGEEKEVKREEDKKGGGDSAVRSATKSQRSPEIKREDKTSTTKSNDRNQSGKGSEEEGNKRGGGGGGGKERESKQHADGEEKRYSSSKAKGTPEDGRTSKQYDSRKGVKSRERHEEHDQKGGKNPDEPDRKKQRSDNTTKEGGRESGTAPGFQEDTPRSRDGKSERGGRAPTPQDNKNYSVGRGSQSRPKRR